MRFICVAGLLLTSGAFASTAINDIDLAGTSEKRVLFNSSKVAPDRVESAPARDGHTSARLVILKDGIRRELPSINFDFSRLCSKGQKSFEASALAKSERFVIQDRSVYEFAFAGTCGHAHTLVYEEKSAAGELAGVWDIAKGAEEKMQAAGIIDMWQRQIKIIFPADGDYYSGDRVRVTKGYQWDVVGHELGHAIYDQARMGSFGGGPHRIDECYSEALALSEGWASFFAAWLKVKRDDVDAKFEYMVPRRAPLRFEHVPGDVCQGPRNEWRVTAFLWDLLDLNRDDEEVEKTFAHLWQATANKRSRNISQMKDHIIASGLNPEAVEAVWEKNFYDR